jgi:hypothetical protein
VLEVHIHLGIAANEFELLRTGSDFVVDVIKPLGIDYVCVNPGSSFRDLHESIINYGGNNNPESITCGHEESSVAMAHGYAKIEGKPPLAMAHSGVGLSQKQKESGPPKIASNRLSLEDFVRSVRTLKGQMPPFSAAQVSEAEVVDIYAFLQSAAS